MSQFSADDILNSQIDQPMETDYVPIPDGEYPANITKVDVRMSGEQRNVPILDVQWELDAPELVESTGLERNIARQSIWLDVVGNSLAGGKGKNIQLGRLEEAVGQNGPEAWGPQMLIGSRAIVRCAQRHADDGTGRVFTDVKNVSKYE